MDIEKGLSQQPPRRETDKQMIDDDANNNESSSKELNYDLQIPNYTNHLEQANHSGNSDENLGTLSHMNT